MARVTFDVTKTYTLDLPLDEITEAVAQWHRDTVYHADAVPVRSEGESAEDFLTRLVGRDHTSHGALISLADSLGLDVDDEDVNVTDWDAEDDEDGTDEDE